MEITTKSGIKVKLDFAHYGEERELNTTDGEQLIADYITTLCPSCRIVRKSDAYITAEYRGVDVARFKFTVRAKWLLFPYLSNCKKRYFEKIEDLTGFEDDIIKSYEMAAKLADM